MRRVHVDVGDGDPCPQDPEHGRMLAYEATQLQLCPHSRHKGNALYEWDGVTPRGAKKKGAGHAAA